MNHRNTLIFLTAFCSLSGCSKSDNDSNSPNFTISSSSSSVSSSSFSPQALAGSPTSLTLNIYGVYVSPNEDCSNSTKILDNGSTPIAIDVYSANTLFSGIVAPGEYKCVGLEMSDLISYRVNAAAVTAHTSACTSTSTVHSGDLYRQGESDDGLWKDANGVAVDATGSAASPSSNRVVTFATTNTAAAASGPLGLHPNQLLPLTSSLMIPGSAVFFADFNDGIDDNSGFCSLEGGSCFGFR